MTKYQEHFINTTSFIKKLLQIKMITLLLGHPVLLFNVYILVHLSGRLMCTFVIKRCPSLKLYDSITLTCLCFLSRSENKIAALVSDWLRYFRLLLWNSWTEFIQRNLTGSKISTYSTKFVVFFGPNEKKKQMAARPLIGWDIFDFSSKTTERNSRKLDSKQDI